MKRHTNACGTGGHRRDTAQLELSQRAALVHHGGVGVSIQAVSSEIADGKLKVIEISDFDCEREFCFVQNTGQTGGVESDFMRYMTRKF